MIERRRYDLVLAIYFNTRGFAFVLFEGHLSPFDWGMCDTRGKRKHRQCLGRIVKLLDQYQPEFLVIRDTSGHTTRTPRIANLNAAIAEMASNRQIPLFAYSREHIHESFAYTGSPDKQSLAELVAKHIPAFEKYVPPPRKPWMSEDRRMGIFDAAVLGLVFFQKVQQRRVSS
jgi:Holliday junction resolvasome RuvABC endonuclease subunit